MSKITDEQKNSPEFLAVVTRVLDLAAEMKEKIVGCKFTQNKTVDGFIEKDSAEKVRKNVFSQKRLSKSYFEENVLRKITLKKNVLLKHF